MHTTNFNYRKVTEKELSIFSEVYQLASFGRFSTGPNPNVGCVIEKDGIIIGRGWHECYGKAHAETNALADCKEDPKGSTAYLNLEPCNTTGHTPPCVNGLIEAKVKKILISCLDPDQRMSGKSIPILKAAGLQVELVSLPFSAFINNYDYMFGHKFKRPLVTAKVASSLDCKIATETGHSNWITNKQSRQDVQAWRAASSAIATGTGTLTADDPKFTVRATPLQLLSNLEFEHSATKLFEQQVSSKILSLVQDKLTKDLPQVQRNKILYCQSSAIDCSKYRFFNLADNEQVIVFCSNNNKQKIKLNSDQILIIPLPLKDGRLDIAASLDILFEQKINSILLECGNNLLTSFLQAELVDRILWYKAPFFIGERGLHWTSHGNASSLENVKRITVQDTRNIDDDLRFWYWNSKESNWLLGEKNYEI